MKKLLCNLVSNDIEQFTNMVSYVTKQNYASVLGTIDNKFADNRIALLGVNWLSSDYKKIFEDQTEIDSQKRVLLNEILSIYTYETFRIPSYLDNFYLSEYGISNLNELNLKSFMNNVIDIYTYKYVNKINYTILVNNDLFKKYKKYFVVAKYLANLLEKNELYTKIITFENNQTKVNNLVDILFTLDDKDIDKFVTLLNYSNGYIQTLKLIADNILKKAFEKHDFKGIDLITQEEQIQKFIEFSKISSDEKTELVPDETINKIKSSIAYKNSIDKLKLNNLGLSKTQQFNVLQSVGLINNKTQKMIYNLSDMGAGKTLMTVQSIYVLDINSVVNLINSQDYYKVNDNPNAQVWLESKNLIAPKLSIKSSWLDTFKLFYDLEYVSDNEYILSFEYDGKTYKSKLYICAFVAKKMSIKVDEILPSVPEYAGRHPYLIIDEVHQLVQRKVNRKKFFTDNKKPYYVYNSFILSGTLSNLTTTEWFNYINFMGTNYGNKKLDTDSYKEMEDNTYYGLIKLSKKIRSSARSLNSVQNKIFDSDCLTLPQAKVQEEKRINREKRLFDTIYSPKVIQLRNIDNGLETNLVSGSYDIKFDSNIIDTPNFELFYNLVGSNAITAQSTTVAKELFGKQSKQHKAEVIKSQSNLSSEDIELLKLLHNIANDFNIYKSKTIANNINNAILNLNDGLIKEDLYKLLNKSANSNLKFFKYLSDLDIDVLKGLQKSSLIKQPELKDTIKFKILNDILSKEPNETYLIVVNDFDAMVKLSKGLGVDYMSKSDVNNQLMYQDVLDEMFDKQNIVVVPQMMIKSSLDLVKANRLIQYQLNTEISDIVQTQNRINRIGQTKETKAFYIATDNLQKNIIELFLETYKNISVAHKGIVELFVDINSQINVVNDYIGKAIKNI